MRIDTPSLARWTLLAAFVLAFTTAPAQAQLGIAGGLNFESSDDIRFAAGETSTDAAFDNSTGYHIGVVYDVGAGPISLRPGLFYRKVGTYEFAGQSGGSSASYDVSVIEVPVDLRYTLLPTPVVSPYLLAGPMASFPRGEDEFDEITNDLSLSANIGAGVEISAPGLPFTLVPELRYEFGITKYVNDDEIEVGDNVTFSPQDEPRFSAFSVRLHLMF